MTQTNPNLAYWKNQFRQYRCFSLVLSEIDQLIDAFYAKEENEVIPFSCVEILYDCNLSNASAPSFGLSALEYIKARQGFDRVQHEFLRCALRTDFRPYLHLLKDRFDLILANNVGYKAEQLIIDNSDELRAKTIEEVIAMMEANEVKKTIPERIQCPDTHQEALCRIKELIIGAAPRLSLKH